ncbi:MAG: hypothetical protein WBK08_07985 [Nitrospira sp.]|jgi:hypothetical protein|nr:MAG: hypothetical protein E8D42_12805 [Nitrospira sp.]
MTIWIDNGKSPDEPYSARLGFWLPPNSPYGNFQLKLMKICQRIDEANRRLTESRAFWEQARPDGISPPNALQRHIYANEQAIYLLRRTADEMISLIWCLSEWQTKGGCPEKIKVDCIGALLDLSPEEYLKPWTPHIHMLTQLNEIANAFKHSFVDSDINVIGRDEPCVYALSLDRNKLASGVQFHGVSLMWLAKAFTAFYKDGMDWLRAFSEQNLPPPVNEQVKDASH